MRRLQVVLVSMGSQSFANLIHARWPELCSDRAQMLLSFYKCVVEENEHQNLTRLIEPEAFWEGHVEDVRAVLAADILDYPAMDLGSGVGVPGLLAAALSEGRWILAESETRKAEFLRSTAEKLGLSSRVEVFAGRAEVFLQSRGVFSVTARAVGPVERIYGWIRSCSTWNNLVLFKGPAWEKEWAEFQIGRYRGELRIARAVSYEVGPEKKQRSLIRLERVPRGTKVAAQK